MHLSHVDRIIRVHYASLFILRVSLYNTIIRKLRGCEITSKGIDCICWPRPDKLKFRYKLPMRKLGLRLNFDGHGSKPIFYLVQRESLIDVWFYFFPPYIFSIKKKSYFHDKIRKTLYIVEWLVYTFSFTNLSRKYSCFIIILKFLEWF